MADEFAIDKIIPDHKNQKTFATKDGNVQQSQGSFNLSIDNEEIKSYNNTSEHNKSQPERMLKNLSDIPGYKKTVDESSELITSDSNFEIAAGEGHGEGKNIIPPAKKKVNLKKDVQKTFKKMLMQNNRRDRENLNGDHQSNESTKFGGSLKNEDFNSEIESKFTKRKMKKSLQKIYYKEDDDA